MERYKSVWVDMFGKNYWDRFWSKVNNAFEVGWHCWEWNAAVNGSGYGSFGLNRKNEEAHRLVWKLLMGDIPEGLCVCHGCDNPVCCNPNHLYLDTNEGNQVYKIEGGRQKGAVGERNCKAEFDPELVQEVWRRYVPYVVTQKQLAEELKVHRTTIQRILHGKTWVHMYDPDKVLLRGKRMKSEKIRVGRGAKPGDKHPNTKVSEALADEIRKQCGALLPGKERAEKCRKYAEMAGVGVRCIRDIATGRMRKEQHGESAAK